MRKVIYFLFALSGALGLLYQVVWARQILLIFGNTTHSTVTVLSVFMSGLASGSYVFGYIADKVKNQLRLWGITEVLIGISAFLFLLLLPLVREIYVPSGLLAKFLASFLLIFPATFFMGGTLPLLIKYFAKSVFEKDKAVSQLYFVNTLGAFLGTLISAFILIELLGLYKVVAFGALINILIGVVVIVFFANYSLKSRTPGLVLEPKEAKTKTPSNLAFLLFAFFVAMKELRNVSIDLEI